MTDDQILALNSLYFHAHYGDDDGWPAECRPLPLDEAVARLAPISDPHEVSAVRRAAAQLLASPRRGAGGTSPFDRAVTALFPDLGPTPPWLAARPMSGHASSDRPVQTYLRMLKAAGPALPCVHTEPVTDVDFDEKTGMIRGISRISVRRPFAECRRVFDPQHWDVLVPQYFVRACVAEMVGGKVVVDPTTHQPQCDATPPTPGSAWSAVLFEHYRLRIARVFELVEFKNLLDVRSMPQPSSHRFEYKLRKVLYGEIATIQKVGSGLDCDDGYIQMNDRGDGWVDIEATKDFRLEGWGTTLTNYLLNWWTSITIRTTLDAAYEAVCKDV